jgi:hypothetical protein
MRTQRICRAWGHSFARGFARVVLDRVRDNLDQAPVILLIEFAPAGVVNKKKIGSFNAKRIIIVD